MKSSITEYIIAVFELFEAEVSSFKKGVQRFVMGIIILILVGVILFAATLFVIWGLYDFYASMMLAYQASFATAASLVVLAFLLMGIAKWQR